jgi:maleylpyruvate isomerase
MHWMDAGEQAVAAAIADLDDAAVCVPSLLPGWTRGHIVTHLARNADALCNLLEWGRSGVEHRMYPSREARAAEIEAGAGRPAAEQLADLAAARGRLAARLADFPADRADFMLRGASGRPLPVSDVPWLRVREVWLHLVDLDLGADLDVIPDEVVERLCRESLDRFAGRADAPPVVVTLLPDGTPRRLGGADDSAPKVSGTARDLVGWLTGRGSAVAAPRLPDWL